MWCSSWLWVGIEKCETDHNRKCCRLLEALCKKSLTESRWVGPVLFSGLVANSEIHRTGWMWYIAMYMLTCFSSFPLKSSRLQGSRANYFYLKLLLQPGSIMCSVYGIKLAGMHSLLLNRFRAQQPTNNRHMCLVYACVEQKKAAGLQLLTMFLAVLTMLIDY
jgi:hypothetical protein